MKKGFSLIVFPLIASSLFLGNSTSLSASANNNEIVVAPTTLPDGNLLSVINGANMGSSSIRFIYNDDFGADTYSYQYKFVDYHGSNAVAIRGVGSGIDIRYKANVINYKNAPLNDFSGVMFYIDTSEIRDYYSDAFGVGMSIFLSNNFNAIPWSYGAYEDQLDLEENPVYRIFKAGENKEAYYFDDSSDQWVETSITKNNVALIPSLFKGYVYIPNSSYYLDGKVSSDNTLLKEAFNYGFNYQGVIQLLTSGMDQDSQAFIYLDDFKFVKSKSEEIHSHDYRYIYHQDASCTREGYDLYKCVSCDQYKKDNIVKKTNHSLNSYYKNADDMCYSECADCHHIFSFYDEELIASATQKNDYSIVYLNLYEGYDKDSLKRVAIKKNTVVTADYIPYIEDVRHGNANFRYTFSCWSNNKEIYTPMDPVGKIMKEDCSYYANYIISDYDNIKYKACVSDISFSGGPYSVPLGKVVWNGNSNISLYHGLESHMLPELPSINNAVAGSSCYDAIEYCDALVNGFRPKMVVYSISSNDQAYWSVKEQDVVTATDEYVRRIHKVCPDAVVCLISANVLPGRSELKYTIPRVNKLIKEYCDRTDKCEFVDAFDVACEIAAMYPIGWDFWTHMDQDQYYVWFSEIKSILLQIKEKHHITF